MGKEPYIMKDILRTFAHFKIILFHCTVLHLINYYLVSILEINVPLLKLFYGVIQFINYINIIDVLISLLMIAGLY